jgi:hypothetical protein
MQEAIKEMSIFDGASPRRGFPLLAELPWLDDPAGAQANALEILNHEPDLAAALDNWLACLSDEDAACAGMESRSTTTHDKWFLGGGEFSGRAGRVYMVWLHNYFAPDVFQASANFAASIHNHRYGFASRLVSGGMDVIEFKVPQPEDGGDLTKRSQYRLSEGDVMSISHDDVHQIVGVEVGTRTLLVQGPAMRPYSTVYRPDGSRESVFGHHAKFNNMRAAIVRPAQGE